MENLPYTTPENLILSLFERKDELSDIYNRSGGRNRTRWTLQDEEFILKQRNIQKLIEFVGVYNSPVWDSDNLLSDAQGCINELKRMHYELPYNSAISYLVYAKEFLVRSERILYSTSYDLVMGNKHFLPVTDNDWQIVLACLFNEITDELDNIPFDAWLDNQVKE